MSKWGVVSIGRGHRGLLSAIGSVIAIQASLTAIQPVSNVMFFTLLPSAAPRGVTAICLSYTRIADPQLQVRAREALNEVSQVAMTSFETPSDQVEGEYSYGGFIDGLAPETDYEARCGDESAWTEWRRFRTWAVAETHPPSRLPDRVVLTWESDPATSQSVSWRSAAGSGKAVAEIVPAAGATDFALHARRLTAVTEVLATYEHGAVDQHSVHFQGLRPNTTYAYRVGREGGLWSEWFQFRTAADRPQPFSFLFFGDVQNSIKQDFSRVLRAAVTNSADVRFLVYAGDLVQIGDSDLHWGEWFGAGGWLNATIPTVPVIGNHEYHLTRYDGFRWQDPGPVWGATFALPRNGPPGMEERVYYVDYQGVRIVALDSVLAEPTVYPERSKDAAIQAEWLDAVLSRNPNRWTVVVFHYPLISARDPEQKTQKRILWEPIFARHDVDLVLNAHQHVYARYHDKSGAGPVYLQSVAGGPPLPLRGQRIEQLDRTGVGLRLYQTVRVDGNVMSVRAMLPDGTLFDGFDLTKDANGSTALVEVPASAQGHGDGRGDQIVSTDASRPIDASGFHQFAGRYAAYEAREWNYAAIAHRSGKLSMVADMVSGRPSRGMAAPAAIALEPISPTSFVGADAKGERILVTFGTIADGQAQRLTLQLGPAPPVPFERAR